MLGLPLDQMIMVLAALIMGLVFHEFAHAYAAYKLGDQSDNNQLRMTLNPLRHIDPFGLLFIVLLGFGWAKPVRINPKTFKRPIIDEIIIAFAGPMANFIIALVFMGTYKLVTVLVPEIDDQTMITIINFVKTFVLYNLMLGIFNLLPIPPLDGSHIYTGWLYKYNLPVYIKVQKYGMYVLIGLLLLGNFTGIQLLPIRFLVDKAFNGLVGLFF